MKKTREPVGPEHVAGTKSASSGNGEPTRTDFTI